MGLIDPFGHLGVLGLGHQQREAKVVHQPLDCALPIALAVAHLDQLTGKGHGRLSVAQGLAKGRADGDLLGVDIAAAAFQAGDFGVEGFVLIVAAGERGACFKPLVLQRCTKVFLHLALLHTGLLLHQQVFNAADLHQPQLFAQFVIACRVDFAPPGLDLLAVDLVANLGNAVATALRDGQAQGALLTLLLRLEGTEPGNFGAFAGKGFRQGLQALINQGQLERGKVRFEGFAAGAQHVTAGQQFGMSVAVCHQRGKQRNLLFGFEHSGVGAAQVVKVGDQVFDAGVYLKRLQHVVAHKVGQVAHRFHRHRLVEQLQRLLTLNAKTAPKVRAVGRKTVKQRRTAFAQARAQGGDGRAEVGKVRRDRQRPFGHGVKALRLAKCIFEPEHLRQRDGLVKPGVVEHAQDHRIAAGIAQCDGFGVAAGLIALRLVVAQHVRSQRALARVGPGRLVVGDALRRHQQRGDGIDQRGFAGTDVARQQAVAATEL